VFGSPGTAVTDVDFTPNRVRMNVATHNAGSVTLNQNYLTGWRASAGKWRTGVPGAPIEIVLPAVVSEQVTLRFVPPGLWLGLALFAIGLAPFLMMFRAKTSGGPSPVSRSSS